MRVFVFLLHARGPGGLARRRAREAGLTLTGMNLAAKRPLAGIPVGGPGGDSPLVGGPGAKPPENF